MLINSIARSTVSVNLKSIMMVNLYMGSSLRTVTAYGPWKERRLIKRNGLPIHYSSTMFPTEVFNTSHMVSAINRPANPADGWHTLLRRKPSLWTLQLRRKKIKKKSHTLLYAIWDPGMKTP